MRPWAVPLGEWKGEDAFLLGGGPSLKGFDPEPLRGRRVIALNDAGLVLAPWADVLFFLDSRWFRWNLARGDLDLNRSRYRICRADDLLQDAMRATPEGRELQAELRRLEIRFLWHDNRSALSHNAGRLVGRDSGTAGINLAYLFGPPRRLYLLGFDMKKPADGQTTNWHDRHQRRSLSSRYAETFIPSIERMAPLLERAGVEVVNLNPDSALRCFPFATIDQVLG